MKEGNLTPADFRDERRSEPRTPCARWLSILPLRASKKWNFISAELVDCSLQGLGLILREPMERGEQFLAKLKVNKIVLLIYTVQNCSPWQRSSYRVGARFSGFAAEQFNGDLGAVLEAILSGAATEETAANR